MLFTNEILNSILAYVGLSDMFGFKIFLNKIIYLHWVVNFSFIKDNLIYLFFKIFTKGYFTI